jgi:hypothetical protein
MMIRILSIFRTFEGYDETHFYSHFNALKSNNEIAYINFDDTTFVDFQVATFTSRLVRKSIKKQQRIHFNKVIQDYIKSFKPNFIFCFKAHHLSSSTLLLAKEYNAKIIIIYPDLEPEVHGKEYLQVLKLADVFIHTKPNLKEYFSSLNQNTICVNPFFSIKQVQNIEPYDDTIGVSFIGHHSDGKQDTILGLNTNVETNISLFGDRWKQKLKSHKNLKVNKPIYGPSVPEIYKRSLYVLGLLTEQLPAFKDGDVMTARSVQIPIYGGLVMHPRNPFSEDFFGSTHTMLFESVDELYVIHKQLESNLELRQALFKEQQEIIVRKATQIELLLNSIIYDFEKGNYNIFNIF